MRERSRGRRRELTGATPVSARCGTLAPRRLPCNRQREQLVEAVPGHTASAVTGLSSNVLSEELAGFLGSGLAIVVATRDALLQPEIARGWGLEVSLDRCSAR